MKAEIISIGTELLLGHIINTNAAYLSQKLAELGIDLYYQTTVGDNPRRLEECLLRSCGRAEVVLTTGGLGPTVDDVTVETLAKISSRRLVLDKTILRELREYFKLRGLRAPPGSARGACIPEGVRWIRNSAGTAPGLIVEHRDSLIIALPGPPRELIPMFEHAVIPYLRRRFKTKGSIVSRLIKTTGLAESQVNHKVKDLLRLGPETTVGIYAKLGQVDLKITSKARSRAGAVHEITKIEKVIKRRLGDFVFGYDDDTLEGALGRLLAQKGKTIAVAESCAGGLVSHRLTDVSGSSRYFMMGLVTYSNVSKVNMLGVRAGSLKTYGAVSRKVALEMAKGVQLLADVDIGLGITGIAGPTGGTRRKPVGLVYVALVTDGRTIVREFRFRGSRQEIKFQTSQVALDVIRKSMLTIEKRKSKGKPFKKIFYYFCGNQ
jgi:nicotinamide-nucleotide amidase